MSCDIHASGAIELYFYGELAAPEASALQLHVKRCAVCRQAYEDLSIIRAALASRPDVAAPPGGDWSGFMERLDAAVHGSSLEPDAAERSDPSRAVLPFGRTGPRASPETAVGRVVEFPGRRLAGFAAMAALLALVTTSVLVVFHQREAVERPSRVDRPPSTSESPSSSGPLIDAALVSLSESHFKRSKLVVLGLATKAPANVGADEWSRERELATALLNDTRVYRVAAEERGMNTLAGVMRDLELVLLQTSMSEEGDEQSLEQLQRLIRRRDLLTKMNVVATAAP
jgi:hypothetical protein